MFPPSHLEFTSVDAVNKTVNLIPGEARARFNIRFNDRHTLDGLKALLQERARKAAGKDIDFEFRFEPSNAPVFVVKQGPFTDMVVAAISQVTGRKPDLSTSGGTSDARFIAAYCPVVEFGLVGQTMHQVDERVPVADLKALTEVYRRILDAYFK
jgi:succinyl-diaminopimelate desuccinylase